LLVVPARQHAPPLDVPVDAAQLAAEDLGLDLIEP